MSALPIMLGGYLITVAGIAAWVRRRHGDQADARTYYVAGGSLSSLTTAASLTATSVGGSSTLLTAALVAQHGLAGIWIDLAGAIGYLLLGLFVAARVRASGAFSIAELAGQRFGQPVRKVVAVTVLLAEIAWLALLARATVALLGPAMPQVTGWQIAAAMLIMTTLYTLIGGQYVVAYSDLAQLLLMFIGLVLLAPVASLQTVGLDRIAELRWDFPFSSSFRPRSAATFLLLTGLPHLVGSDIYAKILSARDGRAAARGAMLAAGMKTLFALGIAIVALCGAAMFGDEVAPEAMLGAMVHRVLPPTFAAATLVALVATMMSSADQVLLSALTMIGHDLWPPADTKAKARRPVLTFAAAATLTLLAFLLACATPTLIDLMKIGYTIFASGLALPILGGVFHRLIPERGVITAIIAGGAAGAAVHVASLLGVALGQPVFWGVGANLLALLISRVKLLAVERRNL